ncbi:MAG: hypothetical protein QM630_07160 [Microbacterium sp.]
MAWSSQQATSFIGQTAGDVIAEAEGGSIAVFDARSALGFDSAGAIDQSDASIIAACWDKHNKDQLDVAVLPSQIATADVMEKAEEGYYGSLLVNCESG